MSAKARYYKKILPLVGFVRKNAHLLNIILLKIVAMKLEKRLELLKEQVQEADFLSPHMRNIRDSRLCLEKMSMMKIISAA